MTSTVQVQLDRHDIELIKTSLCYFDFYEDGEYDKWFGDETDEKNDSFHYLFNLCNKNLEIN